MLRTTGHDGGGVACVAGVYLLAGGEGVGKKNACHNDIVKSVFGPFTVKDLCTLSNHRQDLSLASCVFFRGKLQLLSFHIPLEVSRDRLYHAVN